MSDNYETHYFLRRDSQEWRFNGLGLPDVPEEPWIEVTKAQWVEAERIAGFFPKAPDSGQCATGGFSGHGISGRLEYRAKEPQHE